MRLRGCVSMISVEVIEFCEDNAIGIEKFLNDNFHLETKTEKYNKKNKKWRLKHSEIEGLFNVIPVSLFFAYRYKRLVKTGVLLIVCDDYNHYNAYINPRIINEAYELKELNARLKEIGNDDQKNNDKNLILTRIKELEEYIRIIKHFDAQDAVEQNNHILSLLNDNLLLQREKNNLKKG